MIDFEELSQKCDADEFLNYVTQTTGCAVEKIDEGMEYEIKFKVNSDKVCLYEINKDVSNILEKSNYYANRIERETDYYVDFFLSLTDGFEYSVFIYESKIMMKIKKHERLQFEEFTVCESEEKFEYDYMKILSKLNQPDLVYIGTMRKHRVKDFIIDKSNGFIYASAISECTVLGKKQMQYEIEYYGHYKGLCSCVNKEKVIEELIKTSRVIAENPERRYFPDNQTKLEFVESNMNREYEKKKEVIELIENKMRFGKEKSY